MTVELDVAIALEVSSLLSDALGIERARARRDDHLNLSGWGTALASFGLAVAGMENARRGDPELSD